MDTMFRTLFNLFNSEAKGSRKTPFDSESLSQWAFSGPLQRLPMRSLSLHLDGAGGTTGLALEQGRAVLLEEAGVGRVALVAQDVHAHIVAQLLLDALGGDPPLQQHPVLLSHA